MNIFKKLYRNRIIGCIGLSFFISACTNTPKAKSNENQNFKRQVEIIDQPKNPLEIPAVFPENAATEPSPAVEEFDADDEFIRNKQSVSPCERELKVRVNKRGYVEYLDTIEGLRITAIMSPDTAYSENVGKISYFLQNDLHKDTIHTTYNHFYAPLYEMPNECYSLCRPSLYADLSDNTDVPFKFFDVDFDGENEFLIVHEGYNRRYYQVFKRNEKGKLVWLKQPPYANLVTGYSARTDFDQDKKVIKITEHSGCCTIIREVYRLMENTHAFVCIEKELIERAANDSTEHKVWRQRGEKLVMVSHYYE